MDEELDMFLLCGAKPFSAQRRREAGGDDWGRISV